MKETKIFSQYGCGGRNCNCCGPAPVFRKKHDRMVKRRIRQFYRQQIRKEISELAAVASRPLTP